MRLLNYGECEKRCLRRSIDLKNDQVQQMLNKCLTHGLVDDVEMESLISSFRLEDKVLQKWDAHHKSDLVAEKNILPECSPSVSSGKAVIKHTSEPRMELSPPMVATSSQGANAVMQQNHAREHHVSTHPNTSDPSSAVQDAANSVEAIEANFPPLPFSLNELDPDSDLLTNLHLPLNSDFPLFLGDEIQPNECDQSMGVETVSKPENNGMKRTKGLSCDGSSQITLNRGTGQSSALVSGHQSQEPLRAPMLRSGMDGKSKGTNGMFGTHPQDPLAPTDVKQLATSSDEQKAEIVNFASICNTNSNSEIRRSSVVMKLHPSAPESYDADFFSDLDQLLEGADKLQGMPDQHCAKESYDLPPHLQDGGDVCQTSTPDDVSKYDPMVPEVPGKCRKHDRQQGFEKNLSGNHRDPHHFASALKAAARRLPAPTKSNLSHGNRLHSKPFDGAIRTQSDQISARTRRSANPAPVKPLTKISKSRVAVKRAASGMKGITKTLNPSAQAAGLCEHGNEKNGNADQASKFADAFGSFSESEQAAILNKITMGTATKSTIRPGTQTVSNRHRNAENSHHVLRNTQKEKDSTANIAISSVPMVENKEDLVQSANQLTEQFIGYNRVPSSASGSYLVPAQTNYLLNPNIGTAILPGHSLAPEEAGDISASLRQNSIEPPLIGRKNIGNDDLLHRLQSQIESGFLPNSPQGSFHPEAMILQVHKSRFQRPQSATGHIQSSGNAENSPDDLLVKPYLNAEQASFPLMTARNLEPKPSHRSCSERVSPRTEILKNSAQGPKELAAGVSRPSFHGPPSTVRKARNSIRYQEVSARANHPASRAIGTEDGTVQNPNSPKLSLLKGLYEMGDDATVNVRNNNLDVAPLKDPSPTELANRDGAHELSFGDIFPQQDATRGMPETRVILDGEDQNQLYSTRVGPTPANAVRDSAMVLQGISVPEVSSGSFARSYAQIQTSSGNIRTDETPSGNMGLADHKDVMNKVRHKFRFHPKYP